ncbi:MAG: MATE family efflux transporter [Clostridia bacterium]|nr:MATE family efflux transporter [Clostridia bacterium]
MTADVFLLFAICFGERGVDQTLRKFAVKTYLGNRTILKDFLMIAMPIAIQNGITNFVSMLDNLMVGQLGTHQMNGVSIVNQIQFIPCLALFGAMAGAGIFTAQFYGSGDGEGIRYTFRFKLCGSALLAGVTIAAAAVFGSDLITLFLHSESQRDVALTMQYGMDYMSVAMWSFIPFSLCQVYVSTLREIGQTVVPMKAGLAAVVVNVVMNWVLIFGRLGLPAMGVKGAALATIIARVTEWAIVAVWLHTHSESYAFVKGLFRSFRIQGRLLGRVISKSIPLIINESAWAFGMTFLNQSYSTRGLDAVAGVNICSTLSNVFCVFFIAAGDAIAIMIGQLLGAGRKEEARSSDRVLCTYSVLGSGMMGVIMAVCAPFFPLLYHTTWEVRHLATAMLWVSALMLPVTAFTNAAYFTLRSGGNTFVTFLFDGCYMLCVVVPMAYLLTRFTDLPILPVYMLCQTAEICKAVVGFVMVRKGVWVNNIVEDMT